MDTLVIPASVAGTIITASQVGDLSPLLKWSLAIIAGGGVCCVIQTGTAVVCTASTGTTLGLGNFVVSSIELLCAIVFTILIIVVPVVCLLALAILFCKITARIVRVRSSLISRPGQVTASEGTC